MGIFDFLFRKKEVRIDLSTKEIVEAEACPNCWGKQEYQDLYIEYSKDKTKSNINHDKLHQKTFVNQFVETHLTGIKLKKENDRLNCPKCKSVFAA